MKKVTLVKTDDPNKKKLNLTVTGWVEKIVEIDPDPVYLHGKPGETLGATVTITPSDKYGFSILEMEQRGKSNIEATLIKPGKVQKQWQIKVKSYSKTADDLYDVLTLKTDSKFRPILTIRIYAIFREPARQNS